VCNFMSASLSSAEQRMSELSVRLFGVFSHLGSTENETQIAHFIIAVLNVKTCSLCHFKFTNIFFHNHHYLPFFKKYFEMRYLLLSLFTKKCRRGTT